MGRKERLRKERRVAEVVTKARRPSFRKNPGVLFGGVLVLVFVAALAAFSLGRNAATSGTSPDGSAQGSVAVGKRFPAFGLTEVGGRPLTISTLEGKPAIVWFTTSYCVPCQVGARTVARLDSELGGDAFNVVVVFVDPQEPSSALSGWRERYANPDWLVALDSDAALANAVRLVSLDTKFLLDESGTVRNIDYAVAGDDYVRLIRKEVGAS